MPNLLDILTPKVIFDYTENLNTEPMLGDYLFPNEKTSELEIEWILGNEGLPVAANLHSWDSEAQIGSRVGAETALQELALIKRKMIIKEKEIIKLNAPRPGELNRLIELRFNDVKTLHDSVRVKTEAMKMEALLKGKIEFDENGIKGSIDYKRDNALNITQTELWSDPNTDIIAHIQKAVNDMAAKGKRIRRAVTSSKVLAYLTSNTKIKAAINGDNLAKMITLDEVNTFFSRFNFPTFTAYDAMYNKEAGNGTLTATRYLDENYVVFIPEGPLGKGYFGPTAEEIELTSDPRFNIRRMGNILVLVYKTHEPQAHWTKAVASFMPSFPEVGAVLSMKVLA